MSRKTISLIFLGAITACAQSITVQNAEFENATLPLVNPGAGTYCQLIPGSPIGTGGSLANWTATATSSSAAAGAALTLGGISAGYLYAFRAGVAVSLSQVLSTSLQNNTSYTLSAIVTAIPTFQFSYSIELWAGSTELASSDKLEETPNFVTGTDSFTYYSGSNNPQAGQPLSIYLTTIGAVQGNTGAAFDNISLTASSGQPPTNVLPQLVFGGGWYTALYFTNTTTTPVSFPVNLFDGNGNPLNAPVIGGTSTTVNLPARGTASIQFPNTGALVEGYVSVALPSGVTGYGAFRTSEPGVPDQEAVVPLSGVTNTISTLLFDDTNGLVTGVAIVNLGSATAVNATAYDPNGNVLGTATIPLAPNGKTAAELQSLIPATAGVLGSVDFTVPTGNVAALGLRFNGSSFTSIPTSDR
jgi:hypothetical protein